MLIFFLKLLNLPLKENLGRVIFPIKGIAHNLQHGNPNYLLLKKGYASNGKGSKTLLNHLIIFALALLPEAKILVIYFVWDETIADDEVGEIAIEVKVGKGALGFLNYHLLGVDHQAY
jgi:hypothetical protein